MTVEEFSRAWPDMIIAKLIMAACLALEKNQGLQLKYIRHEVELTPRQEPFCQIVIYYKNIKTNTAEKMGLGELLFTTENMYKDSEKGIRKDLPLHQKVILRLAWQFYRREI